MSFVYSETIFSFLERIERDISSIFTEELKLRYMKRRFTFRAFSYPLHLAIFERKNLWGSFSSEFSEISLHRRLMQKEHSHLLKNVLRHELAHYFVYILYGDCIRPHGIEFQNFCKSISWGEEVYATSMLIEGREVKAPKALQKKLDKLFAMARGGTPHEAEIALAKAQDFAAKHKLSLGEQEKEDQERSLARVLSAPRTSVKLSAIAHILEAFDLYVVMHRGSTASHIEVLGKQEDVDIAEYIAAFLDQEMDRLWEEKKKQDRRLKGLRSKNSFFRGLASSYSKHLKGRREEQQKHGLMPLDGALAPFADRIYSRLSRRSSSASQDSYARGQGEKAGEDLKIRWGLTKQGKESNRLGFWN